MKITLDISNEAYFIVQKLKNAGYEAYIVGGAIRDMLLGKTPKDFDISTSATPEQIRQVFGRRFCRIIGKRFRLAHVVKGGEIYEVSTFRRMPKQPTGPAHKIDVEDKEAASKLLLYDNVYGTAKEDANRRDFTVNALFYDPFKNKILDFTGLGLQDIENKVVRVIGEPKLRFQEDPVRMLRGLKLVALYDFSMDDATENALFNNMHLLECVPVSRLSLELEKIIQATYSDRHLQVFHEYGLLKYFLPYIEEHWFTPQVKDSLSLIYERNCRVDEYLYRNSISLAIACFIIPFVEKELNRTPGTVWFPGEQANNVIRKVIDKVFYPLCFMERVKLAVVRNLDVMVKMEFFDKLNIKPHTIMANNGYLHGRELQIIRYTLQGKDLDIFEDLWYKTSASKYPRRSR